METTVPTVFKKRITGEELYNLGDIGPCELVKGRIVKMSPTNTTHSIIESELIRLLGNFVRERDIGEVMGGEIGIYTGRNPDTVRGADIVVISYERLQKKQSATFLDVPPELIVEIVSPTDRWKDIREKLEEYFAIGVEKVWVVDPDNQSILKFNSPTSMKKIKAETLFGEGILKGFELKLTDLFKRI